jgi:hypothetical protein
MGRVKKAGTEKTTANGRASNHKAAPTSIGGVVVPRALAGKWVAWSPDGLSIVASGSSAAAVEEKAATAGYDRVAIDRIPPARRLIKAGE